MKVSASEYAKYYFHLRSMMARLGFHANESTVLRPLDIAGAKRLQLATESYMLSLPGSSNTTDGAENSTGAGTIQRRFHSVQGNLSLIGLGAAVGENSLSSAGCESHHVPTVGIEQLIHSEHFDADGTLHLSQTAKYHPAPGSKGIRRSGDCRVINSTGILPLNIHDFQHSLQSCGDTK